MDGCQLGGLKDFCETTLQESLLKRPDLTCELTARAASRESASLPDDDRVSGPGWYESSIELMKGVWIDELENDPASWAAWLDELEASLAVALETRGDTHPPR